MRDKDFDIVVIGSGAGGGTVAKELSALCRDGVRVGVLECGPRLKEEEYTGRELEMAERLYVDGGGVLTEDRSVTLAFGRAYGGSTVVYTGTSLALPRDTFERWGVTGLDFDDLQRRSRKYVAENHVHLLPDADINDNNRLFAEGCRRLGYRVEQFPINVDGCQGSGLCNLGCPNAAKMGTHRVQLPEAERNGAVDNIPLVVLACGIRSDTGRAFQLHDIDQLAILRPVTKAVLRPESFDAIYATVRRAFDLARSGTPGPVAVEIPADYYLLTHEISRIEYAPLTVSAPEPKEAEISATAELLNAARHPILYVGNGAALAGAALVELAETLRAPVATTIQGKGVFPEQHPLWLWNGLGASAPPFVRDAGQRADAMLAIGCRFSEVGTASWSFTPPAVLVHVDINREVFNRNFPARIAVESDAAAFVRALLPRIVPRTEDDEDMEVIASGHRDVQEAWRAEASADRVTPVHFFAVLQRHAPDAIYAADSGNGTFLAMEHLRLDAPGRFIAPIDYSCMGYAVPAAVGATLANPDRDVIALAGDGALLMTGLELLTASRLGRVPLVFVFRDGELAQIAQFQRAALNTKTCSVVPPYRVEGFAAAVEAEYLLLATDGDLDDVLGRAFELSRAGRAVMVEVAIDYSRKTYFTRGVVMTTLRRLPLGDRLRMLARAASRHLLPRR